jgi:hypothetical protein
VNETNPEARISGRIQRARPPANAASAVPGAGSAATGAAERATAAAARNTSAFTPAAEATVARNPIAGSSTNAPTTVPITAPAVFVA